jgi:hypothetical protein
MTIAGSGAVSFFGGCGVFFFLMGQAMDFYAVEKKNDQLPNAGKVFNETPQGLAQPPADTNPATVSNGSAADGITTGERYYRNDEQAQANNYTDPDAPADTVQVANVAAPAKQVSTFELEIK